MSKILKFDSEAREKLLKGVNILTEAVASILGPKGRNVAIDKKWGGDEIKVAGEELKLVKFDDLMALVK